MPDYHHPGSGITSMKKRPAIFGLLLLAAAILLAPYARLVIHYLIVEPITYYSWGIRLIAQAIPQSAYWMFLVFSLVFIVSLSLARDFILSREVVEETRPRKGAVQILAGHITRTRKNNYFKWMIANRLAKTALKILVKNNGGQDHHRDFTQIYWLPPDDVKKYLEAGLNKYFIELRERGRFFQKRKTTPFDIDLNQVVKYIESELE